MRKIDKSRQVRDPRHDDSPPRAESSAALRRLGGTPKSEPSSPAGPPRRSAPPPPRDQGKERLTTATYNVAGGNATYHKNFEERTSNLAARELVKGTDVMALQEVSINGKGGPIDYNREILKDVFAEKHGLEEADIKSYFYDPQGDKQLITDANREQALKAERFSYEGGGHRMELTLEQFDKDGNPKPYVVGGKDDHDMTVYRAQMDDGEEYNAVFADSLRGKPQHGYGNTVILGPGMSIRDEQGQVVPGSLKASQLGTDPELWKPESERETRAAVGVRFTTPEGQTATAFSAHLTTESISSDKASDLRKNFSDEQVDRWRQQLPDQVRQQQRSQMRRLEEFARDFGGERNLIVGGDFNNRDVDSLLSPDSPLREGRSVHELDHLLYSQETRSRDQHWVEGKKSRWDFLPFVDSPGYSDHEMLVEDITL